MALLSHTEFMHDALRDSPDHRCLFDAASEQHGLFTAKQARACGFRTNLLTFHVRHGRFARIRRGVYRLRDYPSSRHEDVAAAWLAVGKEVAVVSHESALDLLDLSDVIPDSVHLTLPRTKRYLVALPGVTIHTTTHPLHPKDVVVRDGFRLTAATRTILDAAELGTAPEQVEMAISAATARGLTTARLLEEGAQQRGRRVIDLVAGALRSAAS